MDFLIEDNLKFKSKKLRKVTDEFKFVEEFFKTCRCKDLHDVYNLKNMSIYRITDKLNTHQGISNNIMLFHGTIFENVLEIFKSGLLLLLCIKIIFECFFFSFRQLKVAKTLKYLKKKTFY